MTELVMVLKVRVSKNTRFYEKGSARLFNDEEMKILVEMVSAYVSCGCDVKVEMEETGE